MILVSEAALARKKRFTDAKAEHGGDIAGLTKHIESLDWNVWHDEEGTIISMSKEWNEEDSGKWKTEDTDNFFYEIEEKK